MAGFLDMFTVQDPDKVSASKYQLHYSGSGGAWDKISHADSWVFGMLTGLIYAVFKIAAVIANALMGLVLSSGSWLDPLSDFYESVTSPIYAVFPPWGLACLGAGVVAVSVMSSRPRSTSGSIFSSEALTRIGGALAMVALVAVLAANPFKLLRTVLETANGFAAGLATAVSGGSDHATITGGQSLVDTSIRTPTIALNYGTAFSDSCKSAWSQAQASGEALPASSGCFTSADAGPDTVITAVAMIVIVAAPMLVFAVIAAWKYVLHLSLAALATVATTWVAAIHVHKRRGFDALSKVLALAAAHLLLAVLISMVAIGLPALCVNLAVSLLQQITDSGFATMYATMSGLGVGFLVSCFVMIRLSSNSSPLVRALHADAASTLAFTLGEDSKLAKFASHRTNLLAKNPNGSGGGVRGAWGKLMGRDVTAEAEDKRKDEEKSMNGSPGTSADARDVNNLTSGQTAGSPTGAGRGLIGQRTGPVAVAAGAGSGTVLGKSLVGKSGAAGNQTGRASGKPVRRTRFRDRLASVGIVPADPDGKGRADRNRFGFFDRSGPDTAAAVGTGSDADAEYALTGAADSLTGAAESLTGAADALTEAQRPAERGAASLPSADAIMVPLPGNVYADPALNSGKGWFISTDPTPVPRPEPATTGFGGPVDTAAAAPALPPVGKPGADWREQQPVAPAVAHADPVRILAPDQIAASAPAPAVAPASPTATSPSPGPAAFDEQVPDPASAQAAWNNRANARLARRAAALAADSGKTGGDYAEPVAQTPQQGTVPERNPASFCAPMPDLLARDALMADIRAAGDLLSAGGISGSAASDDFSSLVRVRLSSDPSRRVSVDGSTGFGDPV